MAANSEVVYLFRFLAVVVSWRREARGRPFVCVFHVRFSRTLPPGVNLRELRRYRPAFSQTTGIDPFGGRKLKVDPPVLSSVYPVPRIRYLYTCLIWCCPVQ